MTTVNAANLKEEDIDKLVESLGNDDKELGKSLIDSVFKAFSDHVQNQDFTNQENKDMAMVIGKFIARAYANFVLAFKVAPWVPDVNVAVGAFKAGFDYAVECCLDEQGSATLADLENVSHNLI